MSDRRYIYVLFDPLDNSPRYVGRTHDPEKLQKLHPSKWAYSKGNAGKNEWIKGLVTQGLRPRLVVYEDTTIGRAGNLQRVWIAKIKEWSGTVYNLDKSQKCRTASLRLWAQQEFREKVKEGCKRREERLIAEMQKVLEKIPVYDKDSPSSEPAPLPSEPPTRPPFPRIRTPREEMALTKRRVNRFLKKALNLPPMSAFK